MDKSQKILAFSRGLLLFVSGALFSVMLSFGFHFGNWLAKLNLWAISVLLIICLAVGYYTKRAKAPKTP